MKYNSALPGGLLKSKPMWPNTFGCSATSAFLFSVVQDGRNPATKDFDVRARGGERGRRTMSRDAVDRMEIHDKATGVG